MGAASHLGIDLRDYDARIRTFIPGYEHLLGIASAVLAATVQARSPLVVDLGTGTGALAERSGVQPSSDQYHGSLSRRPRGTRAR